MLYVNQNNFNIFVSSIFFVSEQIVLFKNPKHTDIHSHKLLKAGPGIKPFHKRGLCMCVCVRGGWVGGGVSIFVPIKSNFLNVFNKTFWHVTRCMPNFDIFSLGMSSIPSPICVNDHNKVIQYLTRNVDYYTGRIFLSYNYVINQVEQVFLFSL